MTPMLARTYGPRFNSFPCYIQPKLNGVRALYQRQQSGDGNIQLQLPHGIFQSRDQKIWRYEVLRHLHDELETLNLHNAILDGELYVHGWRLQDINAAVAVNRSAPTEKTGEVEFHVFDVVDPGKNFAERTNEIKRLLRVTDLPHIKFVSTILAQDKSDIELAFKNFVSLGYEGIMLRPDGPYEFGERQGTRVPHPTTYRSKYLWKYKQFEDGEYLCNGWKAGEGKAAIGIGALILETPDTAHRLFSCGTGFTDAERIFYAGNPPIGKLVKVRYPYLSSDGVPQCPSFLAVL